MRFIHKNPKALGGMLQPSVVNDKVARLKMVPTWPVQGHGQTSSINSKRMQAVQR